MCEYICLLILRFLAEFGLAKVSPWRDLIVSLSVFCYCVVKVHIYVLVLTHLHHIEQTKKSFFIVICLYFLVRIAKTFIDGLKTNHSTIDHIHVVSGSDPCNALVSCHWKPPPWGNKVHGWGKGGV